MVGEVDTVSPNDYRNLQRIVDDDMMRKRQEKEQRIKVHRTVYLSIGAFTSLLALCVAVAISASSPNGNRFGIFVGIVGGIPLFIITLLLAFAAFASFMDLTD